MAEAKSLRERRFYPVLFMIIITVIFVGLLATFYQLTRERVETHRQMVFKTTILQLFELPTVDLQSTYDAYIQEKMLDGRLYYAAMDGDSLIGYCLPISGSGLWSTIHAMVAVSPQLDRIRKIEILEQNETPGLGGRITEEWFTGQFAGKMLVQSGTAVLFELIAEDEPAGPMQINQITGATASSKAVVDMLYKEMSGFQQTLIQGAAQ